MTEARTREERIAAARSSFIERAQTDARLLREQAGKLDASVEGGIPVVRETAHRLAGTAGSYGFMRTTDAAQNLLLLIARDAPREEILTGIERLSNEVDRMDGRDP